MSVAFPSVDDSRDRPGCSKLSEASTAGCSAAEAGRKLDHGRRWASCYCSATMSGTYERTASAFLPQVASQRLAAKGYMLLGGYNKLESDQEDASNDEARATSSARGAWDVFQLD